MKKILLVDDSSTMLTSMTQLISDMGHAVTAANSGEAAMTTIGGGESFDLMITDLNMPGMNGIELIAQARKTPKFRFAPILVLTTEMRASKQQEAKQAGATGWLTKPVKKEQLVAALDRVLH